jgi:Flp pilus assembly pilin Flp
VDQTVKPPSTTHRLSTDDRGQDLIEYAVIATFISLLAIVAATALNVAVGNLYAATARGVDRGAQFGTASSASTTPPVGCPNDPSQNPPCK